MSLKTDRPKVSSTASSIFLMAIRALVFAQLLGTYSDLDLKSDWATPKDLKRLRKESLDLSNKLGTARTAFKIATDEAKLAAWKEKYIAAPPAPVEPPAAMTEAGQPETASVKTVEEDKAEGEERRKILQRPDNPPDVQVMKEEAQPNRGPAALVSKPSPAAEGEMQEAHLVVSKCWHLIIDLDCLQSRYPGRN